MSSSESSDDENSALLREAVDTQFIHDGMFNSTSTSAKKAQESPCTSHNNKDLQFGTTSQPSLRPNTDQDDQFNMLGVTPQFQQYVAKQLSNVLDEKLQKKLKNGVVVNNLPQKRKKGGIKLFHDSKKYIKLPKTEKVTIRTRVESESDDETKFSEVSVNPEDILSKKDVEHWATRSKAPIFRYKKSKNGTLASVD